MKADYHCHTRWCNHADGEIEDYIKVAIKRKVKILAITEHVPHRDNADPRRMKWEDFEIYNSELDELIEKYKKKIKIIKGFECEYYPDFMQDYKNFRDNYNYEIMILGHHTSADRKYEFFDRKGHDEILIYSKEVCKALKTGFFTFLAHIDVPLCGYYYGIDDVAKKAFDDIFKVCEEMDIPVEYNANGVRCNRAYPSIEVFNFSKKYKLRYMVNGDAHSPEYVYDDSVVNSKKMLIKQGFNVIDTL